MRDSGHRGLGGGKHWTKDSRRSAVLGLQQILSMLGINPPHPEISNTFQPRLLPSGKRWDGLVWEAIEVKHGFSPVPIPRSILSQHSCNPSLLAAAAPSKQVQGDGHQPVWSCTRPVSCSGGAGSRRRRTGLWPLPWPCQPGLKAAEPRPGSSRLCSQ